MLRKVLAFAAFAAVAATLTGTANAASFKGVVVAKDTKRKALVTASAGAVRTVRAPGRYGRFQIGQRVVVTARRRSDGTFVARTLRPAGKSKQVRFSAVVVKSESARLIVTAGGSVFAFRLRGLSTSSLKNDGHELEPGDKVDVDADVKDGHIEAGTGDVDQTGHVEMLVLEGIFLWTKGDGFELAVVHRGLVHVSVPTGMVLPEFKAGDQIVVAVSVSAAGKFSFVKGQKEGAKTPQPDGTFAYGPLVERSAFSVGVKRENGEVFHCAVPAGLDLSWFRIGEKVKLYCELRGGHLVLKKMASDHAAVTGDGMGEVLVEGTLTEASADAAALSLDDGSLRCLNGAHLDLSPFVLGERALMGCRLVGGQFQLFKLKNDRGFVYAGSESDTELYVYGVVAERSTSLVVRRDDGSSKACAVPAGMDLQGFRIGDRVKMHCHLGNGAYALVDVFSENAFAKADGTGAFSAYGTLFYKQGVGIAVRREDQSVVTCIVPSDANLDAFPLGTRVKIRCVRHEGSYQLAELQSETSHIVLEP